MDNVMKQLKKRIERLLKNGKITDPKEHEILQYLLRTKKWNPYCIRHSAITYDSDSLPEFALKKKEFRLEKFDYADYKANQLEDVDVCTRYFLY